MLVRQTDGGNEDTIADGREKSVSKREKRRG